MNISLQQLIQKFQENPIINNQKDIEDFYIKNPADRENIQKELLQFFKEDNIEDKLEWSVFFNFDNDFWTKVYLIEEEKKAKESLSLCEESKSRDFIIEMTVDLGVLSYHRAQEDLTNEIANSIEQIWLEVFKEFPLFKTSWDKEKAAKIERYKEYYKDIPEYIEPETIKILEIKVPVEIRSSSGQIMDTSTFNNIKDTSEYIKFMSERIDFFNNFNLHSYMDIPACHSVSMNIEDNYNIFTFKLHQGVDLDKLQKAIKGQLSDGLGSNLSQKPLLIKDNVYYFDFDYKNSSDFYEKPTQIKKIKI